MLPSKPYFCAKVNCVLIGSDNGLLHLFSAKPLSKLARARPAVLLGLWSITSSLRGNLYVPGLHKFIKWFADNDVPHRN